MQPFSGPGGSAGVSAAVQGGGEGGFRAMAARMVGAGMGGRASGSQAGRPQTHGFSSTPCPSRAFLSQGEFIGPWHILVGAIHPP